MCLLGSTVYCLLVLVSIGEVISPNLHCELMELPEMPRLSGLAPSGHLDFAQWPEISRNVAAMAVMDFEELPEFPMSMDSFMFEQHGS